MSEWHVHGIGSCDTCRKARRWLEESGRAHVWHDLREEGIEAETLARWVEAVGPATLVNRRSTTWRGLDEDQRAQALDAAATARVLAEHPTLIKRPVFERDGRILVGFNAAVKEAL